MRRNDCIENGAFNRRMREGLDGADALLALGSTPPFQDLLGLSGGLTLWSMGDRKRYVSASVTMFSLGIVLGYTTRVLAWGHNDNLLGPGEIDWKESFRIGLSHSAADRFLNRNKLKRLCTAYGFDLEEEVRLWHRKPGMSAHPETMLFQFLVECADPEKLEGYVTAAVSTANH